MSNDCSTDHITSEDIDRAVESGYRFNILTLLDKAQQEIQAVYDDNRIPRPRNNDEGVGYVPPGTLDQIQALIDSGELKYTRPLKEFNS